MASTRVNEAISNLFESILDGTFEGGKPLPAEVELAAYLEVSAQQCARPYVIWRPVGFLMSSMDAERSSGRYLRGLIFPRWRLP